MRHILLSLLILTSTALCAEDAASTTTTKALPADAQQLVDREAAAEQALQAELDTKVAKLKHELATKLKPCEDHAIHAGNLDQAEAVKAEIEGLQGKAAEAFMLIPAEKAVKMDGCAFDAPNTPGLLGGSPGATCSYPVSVEKGSYYLYALFTAASNRPCDLAIDGAKVGTVLKEVTGSWDPTGLRWFQYGPYDFSRGDHMLTLKAVGWLPNIRGFAISKESGHVFNADAFDSVKPAR